MSNSRRATASFRKPSISSACAPGPIESQKKRVLKVGLVRNTRILEICGDAAGSAEGAGAGAVSGAGHRRNEPLARRPTAIRISSLGMVQQQRELRAAAGGDGTRVGQLLAHEPVGGLQAESENAAELRSSLEQQISNVAAGTRRRRRTRQAGVQWRCRGDPQTRRRTRARGWRNSAVSSRPWPGRRPIARNCFPCGWRIASGWKPSAKRVQTQLTAVETQLREARGGAGYRGERLKIIDPGIVPERPSSPEPAAECRGGVPAGPGAPGALADAADGLPGAARDGAPHRLYDVRDE